jgi:hypothetical protein
MDAIDCLMAFEEHMERLERATEDARARERGSTKRLERQRRDQFKVTAPPCHRLPRGGGGG